MAPTNHAKSNREEAVQRALGERDRENIPFGDLTLEFGIPEAALSDRFQEMVSRQRAYKSYQG